MDWIETSSKTGENVRIVFERIAKKILNDEVENKD